MTTLATKLDDLRSMLAANLTDRSVKEARVDEILTVVEARSDQTPNDAESAEVQTLRAAVIALDADRATLNTSITEAEAREAARTAAEAAARSLPTAATTTAGTNVSVRSEERTYRPGGQNSFFADLYRRQYSFDPEAAARLARHEAELKVELRDTVVSGMGGMIPPKYLTDQYAPTARAGRPLLNSLLRRPLPSDGVSFFIPRGTTTATGGFVVEGAAFIEVDSTVDGDNPMVQLIGAYSDISRTVFERGGSVTDDIIFPDLIDVSEVAEDRSAIIGTTAPGFNGILNNVPSANKVAYTDASPTVAEAWPKIADAIQRINSARFMPATAIYMHPRRWGWITAALDSQNRPLFNFTQTPLAVPYIGLGSNLLYGQIVGTLQNLPVITDANIPTTLTAGVGTAGTEDIIIVARTPDILFLEDDMMRFTFEQTPSTAPGQVRLAAGRFVLLHAGRYPTGLATISGTGLAAPTF